MIVVKICAICNKEFADNRRGRHRVACSDKCRAEHNRNRNRENYYLYDQRIADILDNHYTKRDFKEEYEIQHPYVVDTMLHEAHERNQGRSYRHRCATCATRITDEPAAVKHKGDWFCDAGCFRLRTSQCYWRRRYRPGHTAGASRGYRRKEG